MCIRDSSRRAASSNWFPIPTTGARGSFVSPRKRTTRAAPPRKRCIIWSSSSYDRFGYHGLFAAYNAGPTRYAAFISDGQTLPAETRAYVRLLSGAGTVSGKRAPVALVAVRSKVFAVSENRAIFFVRR